MCFLLFPARDYELDRSAIELQETIGQGQFGDVHKGLYVQRDNSKVPVAVKTCKPDGDSSTGEKFLEEACKFPMCDLIPIRDLSSR